MIETFSEQWNRVTDDSRMGTDRSVSDVGRLVTIFAVLQTNGIEPSLCAGHDILYVANVSDADGMLSDETIAQLRELGAVYEEDSDSLAVYT